MRSFDEGKGQKINAGGREYTITPELVEIRKEMQKISGRWGPPGIDFCCLSSFYQLLDVMSLKFCCASDATCHESL